MSIKLDQLLDEIPVSDTGLPTRITASLEQRNVLWVSQLINKTSEQLQGIPGFGKMMADETIRARDALLAHIEAIGVKAAIERISRYPRAYARGTTAA